MQHNFLTENVRSNLLYVNSKCSKEKIRTAYPCHCPKLCSLILVFVSVSVSVFGHLCRMELLITVLELFIKMTNFTWCCGLNRVQQGQPITMFYSMRLAFLRMICRNLCILCHMCKCITYSPMCFCFCNDDVPELIKLLPMCCPGTKGALRPFPLVSGAVIKYPF